MFGCNIDWSATGDMLQGWGSILGAIAIIIAAVLGSRTFEAWRKQNLSERKVVQAERILTATYRARGSLARIRHHFMSSREIDQARAKLIEQGKVSAQIDDHLLDTQARYNRILAEVEVPYELDQCLPMARAMFGDEVEKAIEAMKHHFWSVHVAVGFYHQDQKSAVQDPSRPFAQKMERILWSDRRGFIEDEEVADGGTPLNEMDVEIAKNVALIEAVCLPALRLET